MAADKAPVRVGLIGVGGICRHHIGQILPIENVEIVALCDIVDEQMDKAVERFPKLANAARTNDYKELLARTDVDAVQIATPHTLHFEQAMNAVESGKHLLLEKPMVCQVDQAHQFLARMEKKPDSQVVALAYQRHAQGQFMHMREKIASGELGAVTFIAALQCQEWKKGTTGSWRQTQELSGGGQINDSGSHLLDILLWVSGLTVAEVSAFMDNMGTPVDINSAVTMRFTNGAQGTISIVGDAPSWHEDLTIWCEKGAFFFRNGTLSFVNEKGKRTTLDGDTLPAGQNIDQNFFGAIRGENAVAAPPVCGLRTIELTEASWKSAAQNGAVVKMN